VARWPDYEVFLLLRIREAYDSTGDNAAAVTGGLSATARVTSAAAAIMVAVFLSFVLGANVSVKQVGLGGPGGRVLPPRKAPLSSR
jgi:putative drug exporter of the RND superfamily